MTIHITGVKLSSKGRYGVKALFDIAYHHDGLPTQVREIAERELIPPRFLEQIFQDLKRAGLIQSKRGPRGGYQLKRPAEEITVGDVIRALEGAVAVIHPPDESRADGQPDAARAIFLDLADSVERCFDAVSIADMCARGKALGVPQQKLDDKERKLEDQPDYVI